MKCELADFSLDLGGSQASVFLVAKPWKILTPPSTAHTPHARVFSKNPHPCGNFHTALYFSLTYLAFEIPYRGDWKIQQGG